MVPTPVPAQSTHTLLHEIAVVSSDDLWAVGRKLVPAGSGTEVRTLAMHWNGQTWTIVPTPSPSPYPGAGWAELQSVHAVTSDDVWAAGSQFIQAPDGFLGTHIMVQHWDGAAWSVLPTPVTVGGSGNFVDDIEVLAKDDIWFVGDWLEIPLSGVAEKRALAMHWDGSSFTIHSTPFFDNSSLGGHGLTAVSGSSSDDVWAVGGGHDGDYVGFSYIVHWNGQRWSHVPGPTAGWFHRLYDVQAFSTSEVYAVGDYQDASGYHGLFLRWNGSNWTRLPDPPVGGGGLEVFGPGQVYVSGSGVARWDGSSWSTVADFGSVQGPSLASLEASGACALWGCGRALSGAEIVPLTVRLDPYALGTPYCIGAANSAGAGAQMGATGSTSLSAANLTLLASACPPSQNGLFVYGDVQQQLPLGNGFLCVGGALRRCPVLSTTPGGTAAHLLSYADSPIQAGSTWNFQLWYRDAPAGGAGFNLSNGLQLAFVP